MLHPPSQHTVPRWRAAPPGILVVALAVLAGGFQAWAQAITSPLHTSGLNIVNGNGATVQLRGVNLGGWLVMEPWMVPADSSGLADEHSIIQTLDTRFGVATEQSLIQTYRQNWIATQDLANLQARGLNVVRVPVWWGDFYALGNTTTMRPDAFTILDWLVSTASARGIYTIIDMAGRIKTTTGPAAPTRRRPRRCGR
jgi:endoglucanase